MAATDGLRDALRARGLRATPGRARVLGLLRAASAPLTSAEVAEGIATLRERATVHRVLLDLVRVGLACRIDFGDRLYRFEATDDSRAAPRHPHFVCSRCARVSCLDGVELEVKRGKRPRLLARQALEIRIRGLCDDCA